jgi:hypothetical protein
MKRDVRLRGGRGIRYRLNQYGYEQNKTCARSERYKRLKAQSIGNRGEEGG